MIQDPYQYFPLIIVVAIVLIVIGEILDRSKFVNLPYRK